MVLELALEERQEEIEDAQQGGHGGSGQMRNSASKPSGGYGQAMQGETVEYVNESV